MIRRQPRSKLTDTLFPYTTRCRSNRRTRLMNRKSVIVAARSIIALAACDKEPTGQVAAVVNGDEITLQEINAELGNTAIPEGVDKKVVQQAALERIVERRLLAQAARDEDRKRTRLNSSH